MALSGELGPHASRDGHVFSQLWTGFQKAPAICRVFRDTFDVVPGSLTTVFVGKRVVVEKSIWPKLDNQGYRLGHAS